MLHGWRTIRHLVVRIFSAICQSFPARYLECLLLINLSLVSRLVPGHKLLFANLLPHSQQFTMMLLNPVMSLVGLASTNVVVADIVKRVFFRVTEFISTNDGQAGRNLNLKCSSTARDDVNATWIVTSIDYKRTTVRTRLIGDVRRSLLLTSF